MCAYACMRASVLMNISLFLFQIPLFIHRTLAQQPMRVVMPSGAVQTAGTTQIIQTHIMPQAMIKQGKHEIQLKFGLNQKINERKWNEVKYCECFYQCL